MPRPMDPSVVRWINQQSADLARQGEYAGSPREAKLIRHWSLHRPEMYRQLQAAHLTQKLAQVLDHKRYQARRAYIEAGMPPTDAEEQASREWLLMEPEDETEGKSRFPSLSALTSM